jgi:hypothetical protein
MACDKRNSKCIEPGRAIPIRKTLRRKELGQRIATLENLVRAQSDSSDEVVGDDSTNDEFCPVSRTRPSETNSVEEPLNDSLRKRSVSPIQFKDSLFTNGFDRVSCAFDLPNPAIRTTLFPIGGFKHEKDCKMLLNALKGSPNIREALEKQSHFWARKMRSAESDSSSTDETFVQYARRALSGDNPIKIARIVQAVASVTLDVRLYEDLLLIVDRLIVSDDEYLSTLEGMECTLEQGRLLIEMGQVRRSW